MNRTLARRMAASAKDAIPKQVAPTIPRNPYQARKVWPPRFQDLNSQQQLRFEKKWKRRMALASYSPRWDKGLQLAQLATIAIAMVYLFFFHEFDWRGEKYNASKSMAQKTAGLFDSVTPERQFELRPDAEVNPSSSKKEEPKSK